MLTIGTFTKNQDGYKGEIRTIGLAITSEIKPVKSDNEKAPNFRVYADTVEVGAGWVRTAKESGDEYISIKMDDPCFPATIYAVLVEREGQHLLQWSRKAK